MRAALGRLGDADPRGHEALLHGDLHARNVLLHGAAWRVIDPHGQRGDRHAEVWPLLEASVALPAERGGDGRLAWTSVEAYAGAAEMDAERAAAWASLLAGAQAYGYDARKQCDEGTGVGGESAPPGGRSQPLKGAVGVPAVRHQAGVPRQAEDSEPPGLWALICSGGRVVLPVDRGLLFARSTVVFSLRGFVGRLGPLII